MRDQTCKKILVTTMSLTILGGGVAGMSGTAVKPLDTINGVKIVEAKIRKPVTKTNRCTMKLKSKTKWLGVSKAGTHPQTKNWKSSNSKIATVATKGDAEGGHKVTAKKKGKVTISCTVSKTSGNFVKGDTYRWILTIK